MDLYSGVPQFEYELGPRLCRLRFFAVLCSPYAQMLDWATTAYSQILSNYWRVSHHMTRCNIISKLTELLIIIIII
jgi:hypothetical protein